MNRLAVVLAADSATTVTSWVDGAKEERYFKGANKVYQLSGHHPIGMMIFDSADMLSVPWEVIIKEFRRALGQKSHNSVSAYATEFFNFLNTNVKMFPLSIQKNYVVGTARSAVLQFVFDIKAPAGTANTPDYFDQQVADRIAILEHTAINTAFPDDLIQELRHFAKDDIVQECDDIRANFTPEYPGNSERMAELAILEIARDPRRYLSTTGIVFAGFGDDDVFPCMIEYIAYGLVAGHHISQEKNRETIDHENPASLTAFAQTSMADTFMIGFGFDAYLTFGKAVSDGLVDFAKDTCQQAGGDIARIPDFEKVIAAKVDEINTEVLNESKRQHSLPLRRVLGALPVDEMAELAETLINLQSLKEKVTKPSTSVGGPVDVAVITRAEGLIWIRRKHFFDPSINSRYMQRQAASLK